MEDEIYICNEGENDLASLTQIVDLQNRCLNSKRDVIIKFNGCEFISPNGLTVIGSLPFLAKQQGKEVKIDLESINNYGLKRWIYNSGFMSFFNPELTTKFSGLHSISFKKFDLNDKDDTELIYNYIEQIKNLIPVKMDVNLEEEIKSKLYEIFRNAFDHSDSKVGVYGCGHYYENKGILNFCLYDAGVGIPDKVRMYLNNANMESRETLEWAVHSGNSTVTARDYPRGVGFELLSEFIELNGGNIKIWSYDSSCQINTRNNKIYENTQMKLLGTMFSIEIKSDPTHFYKLVK